MFNQKNNKGQFTKNQNWVYQFRLLWFVFLISTFMFTYTYSSILALYGSIKRIGYITPVQAQTRLETPNIAPQVELQGVLREVTMYNAGDPAQTDSSPCISANGENVCNAIALGYKRCAANFVPLGTDLIIQNYGECKVTDRMNSRYKNRVDIAVGADEYQRAINFGLQNLLVTIK